MSTVLVIPDIHAPFHHKETIPFLQHVYKEFGCDRVVCLGDEVDFACLNRFGLDPNGMGGGLELAFAKSFLKEFWAAFPVMEICTSNHTSRPFRKAFEAGIPEEMILGYKKLFEAPDGISWHERIIIEDVLYCHGEGYSGAGGALKAAMMNRMSTVIGHLHTYAGVQYQKTRGGQIFGMNAGCLIDESAYAFKYAKHMANRPNIGCGVVYDGECGVWVPLRRNLK